MGIIHCPEFDFAIYTPPKCGSWVADYIATLPDFKDHFVVDAATQFTPRQNQILILRNHPERILSAYYDKIVCPHSMPSKYGDYWREIGEHPADIGYTRGGVECFDSWVRTLGPHVWDTHIQPFLTQDIIMASEMPVLCQIVKNAHRAVLYTHEISTSLMPCLNYFMKRDKSVGQKEISEYQTPHKITYSTNLPPPQKYGAAEWKNVHYDGLRQCYLDTGALPHASLIYDLFLQIMILHQVGYMRDEVWLRRPIESGPIHSIVLVYNPDGSPKFPQFTDLIAKLPMHGRGRMEYFKKQRENTPPGIGFREF